MPPATEESHPPPGVPDKPEDAEGEESDEYDIEVGDNGLFWFYFIPPLNTMMVLSRTMKSLSMPEKTMKRKGNRME